MLGRSPHAHYAQYAEAIRQEYCHVPHSTFGPGRTKVLEGFLGGGTAQQQPLYFTGRAQALFEAKARENIAAEVHHLRSRLGGGP